MKKRLHQLLAALLIAAFTLASLSGCGGKTSYKKEQNTDEHAVTYPYVVHTPSADIYLAAADIELLGVEAFDDGLNRLLENLEADLQDARDVLKPYMHIQVPKISIYTDFSGRTEEGKREEIGGYYNDSRVDIHVFHSWEQASVVLLHEYTHYLSIHCCDFELEGDFWREALADYVSKIRCKNRMCVSVNYCVSDEELKELLARGAGTEDGKLNIKLLYYGTASMYRSEVSLGMPYLAVSQAGSRVTQAQLETPFMNEMSYYEAACLFEYLVDNYGSKKVFSHLDITAKEFPEVFGKTFAEVVQDWTAALNAQCKEQGLKLGWLE